VKRDKKKGTKQMQKIKHYQHGEYSMLSLGSIEIPPDAKPISWAELTADKSYNGDLILCPSESSGNHHVLERNDNIELFTRGDTLYMRVKPEAQDQTLNVYCVDTARHDAISIPLKAGELLTGQRAMEYDYLEQRSMWVRD